MHNRMSQLLGTRYPIIQAPMGGGIALAELAGAVSRAGGLGTLCLTAPAEIGPQIAKARAISGGQPVALNLLLPYTGRAHRRACEAAQPDVVSLFFGFDRALVARLKRAQIKVLHQVGTLDQAQRALDDGADGLIVQGIEAGGHVWGQSPLEQILTTVRRQFPDLPIAAAGGIGDPSQAQQVLAWGADGIALGTRFLLSHESKAHAAYKQALLGASSTTLTRLFGFGWTAQHRVVANNALRRWAGADGATPGWIHFLNTLGYLTRALPLTEAFKQNTVARQRWTVPFFTPGVLVQGMPKAHAALAQATALYAGTGVDQMDTLMSAADIVAVFAKALEEYGQTNSEIPP